MNFAQTGHSTGFAPGHPATRHSQRVSGGASVVMQQLLGVHVIGAGTTPQTDNADSKRIPTARLILDGTVSSVPSMNQQSQPQFLVRWFNPVSGAWPRNATVRAMGPSVGGVSWHGKTTGLILNLTAPGTGDWVAILTTRAKFNW